MRRRPCLVALVALCSLVFVMAGCSGDDEPESDTTTTEAGASTEAADGSTTTAPEAEDAAVDCDAYYTVTGLFASVEEIASGSNEGQVAADETLATAIATLAPSAEGDDIVTSAVETLGQVSFQVTDAEDGPSVDEIDSALVTIEDAWGSQCTGPIECPAPETLEAEGLQCDAEGHVTPLEMEEGGGEAETPECPAPEVLEAEGFSCDSEGNLTPVDEETVGECPAPEVLEAEGYTCDSEGHLTPVEGAAGAEDPAPEDEPVECPAPEVLEA
ncbi:MAG TPA: hypothetical protein VGO60_06065, partial [Iamia sp.]|nr:hypothetical protein [Iamia sp.]